MNAKGFLGILNNLDMLTDADLKKALDQAKPNHLAAALRSRNLRPTVLRLLAKEPRLMSVLAAGGKGLTGQVEKLAQDKDTAVARLAIQVLGKLPKDSLPTKKLRSSSLHAINPEVKSTAKEKKRALMSLGILQDADAVNLVRHTAKTDRLKSVRDQAWITLAGMGERGQRQLIAEARSQVRRRSSPPDSGMVKALALLQSDSVSDLLVRFSNNPYLGHSDTLAIVKALIEQGTDRSFKCLADIVCQDGTNRWLGTQVVYHLARQKRTAASRALIRIAKRHGRRFVERDLIEKLGRMPGKAIVRFLLEMAVTLSHNAEHKQAVIDALVSRRDKHTFTVLRDMALTGNSKEARLAKRIIRKRGETDKFREHLLANL